MMLKAEWKAWRRGEECMDSGEGVVGEILEWCTVNLLGQCGCGRRAASRPRLRAIDLSHHPPTSQERTETRGRRGWEII